MVAAGAEAGEGGMGGDAPALPPFFKQVVALNAARHGALKLDRSRGYGFAAGVNALPLGLGEVPLAAQHYPVVLTAGPNPVPVAVLGYRNGENLFVDKDGAWLAGAYVPAYVRSFPFILIEPPSTGQNPAGEVYLGIETTTPMLGETGEALFAYGEPTELVAEAMRFAVAYRDELARATAFGQALRAAEVLQANAARLDFKDGGTARLDGFQVIDAAKIEALDDARFLDWRRQGWLAALYAIPQSAARWATIVDRAHGRRRDEP